MQWFFIYILYIKHVIKKNAIGKIFTAMQCKVALHLYGKYMTDIS